MSELRLSQVIGALSYALDLTEGQPPGHCLRCCWIGVHVGRAHGLDQDALHDLYYTLLLKDAGCSSNAARLCELYGSDDLAAKHDVKTVDLQSLGQVARFVLSHVGSGGGGAFGRLGRLLHLAHRGPALARELVATRCERGAEIAQRIGFSAAVSLGIHGLDEHWNGKGHPEGLAGEAIPIGSRIALLSQVIDVFHAVGGPAAARAEVRRRSGTWFDPALVATFEQVADDEELWSALGAEDLQQRVDALEPGGSVALDDGRLDEIAAAFGQVIDSKSPFTAGHSERVAVFSAAIADELSLAHERRPWVRRGALLHDMGKLGVSNAILDKPGKLDDEEWAAIRRHPEYTEQILSRLAPFRSLARQAGAHHERLDGDGYPRGLRGREIALETRIITCADIFDALTADRPYRAAMPLERALGIMEELRGSALDPAVLGALRARLPELGFDAADAGRASA